MKTFILAIFLISSSALAGVSLPIHSLRDQAWTAHCWAYAMSNLLESRALVRDSLDATINVEKDVKYWVDYERMLYIYRTKKDFYLGESEGAWQIEFWETFLKHGKHIHQVHNGTPDVWYKPFITFTQHLPFMEEPRPDPDPTLISFDQAAQKLKTSFTLEEGAVAFIRDYLDRYYGKQTDTTKWFDKEIQISELPPVLLNSDFAHSNTTESMVLIKPVTDTQYGWVKYLSKRYWGYRYDRAKILKLIQVSLDNKWPVTYDNVSHAMTIIGYESNGDDTYYAVADSSHGKITWYSSSILLLYDLNLLTFAKAGIPGELPPPSAATMSPLAQKSNLDEYDTVDFPPR